MALSSTEFRSYNLFKTDKNIFQHNLATRVDKAAIMEAYNDVMADNNNIEWSVSRSFHHHNNKYREWSVLSSLSQSSSKSKVQCHMAMPVTSNTCTTSISNPLQYPKDEEGRMVSISTSCHLKHKGERLG